MTIIEVRTEKEVTDQSDERDESKMESLKKEVGGLHEEIETRLYYYRGARLELSSQKGEINRKNNYSW